MRRSPKQDWWIDNGQLVGVCLGADYTSEHEWGIKGIENALAIRGGDLTRGDAHWLIKPFVPSIHGIERRTVKKPNHECLRMVMGKEKHCLLFTRYPESCQDIKQIEQQNELWISALDKGQDTSAAWDENSFGILTTNPVNKLKLKDLYNAIKSCDAAIYIGASAPFQSGGLNILITSRVPEKFKQEMFDHDLDVEKLKKAAKDAGVAERLKAAGKNWYALAPQWNNFKNPKLESKYPVIFWLNPTEQNFHNHGWFTVEQLDLWAKDEGPVPKKNNPDKPKESMMAP